MSDEKDSSVHEHRDRKVVHNNGAGGAVYGIAFIGAAIYFIQHAATFWMGVLGILKAIIWPAMLVYKLLEFLKM